MSNKVKIVKGEKVCLIEKKEIPNVLNPDSTGEAVGYFYKESPSDTMWWVNVVNRLGEYLFSFDQKKIYNLFRDYPHKLTKEEKEIFDKENPFWKEFFKNRTTKNK